MNPKSDAPGCLVHRLVRVILDNPGGYNNYQGIVTRVFSIGNQEWADIEWDMPIHPCTTPMETRHLIPANVKVSAPARKEGE